MSNRRYTITWATGDKDANLSPRDVSILLRELGYAMADGLVMDGEKRVGVLSLDTDRRLPENTKQRVRP